MRTKFIALGCAMLLAMGLSLASTAGVTIDTDGDGASDPSDNCTLLQNANGNSEPLSSCVAQEDDDGDQFGNICDQDLDNDNTTLAADVAAVFASFGSDGLAAGGADFDCDGTVLAADVAKVFAAFNGNPGPSGLVP